MKRKPKQKLKAVPGLGAAIHGAHALNLYDPYTIDPLPELPIVDSKPKLKSVKKKGKAKKVDADPSRTAATLTDEQMSYAWYALHCPSKAVSMFGKPRINEFGIEQRVRRRGTLPVRPIAVGTEAKQPGTQCKDRAEYLASVARSDEQRSGSPNVTVMPPNADAMAKAQQRWKERTQQADGTVNLFKQVATIHHANFLATFGGETLRQRYELLSGVREQYGVTMEEAREIVSWAATDQDIKDDLGIVNPNVEIADNFVDTEVAAINHDALSSDEKQQWIDNIEADLQKDNHLSSEEMGMVMNHPTNWFTPLGYALAQYVGLDDPSGLYDQSEEFINTGLQSLHNATIINNCRHARSMRIMSQPVEATPSTSLVDTKSLDQMSIENVYARRSNRIADAVLTFAANGMLEPAPLNRMEILSDWRAKVRTRKNLSYVTRRTYTYAQWIRRVEVASDNNLDLGTTMLGRSVKAEDAVTLRNKVKNFKVLQPTRGSVMISEPRHDSLNLFDGFELSDADKSLIEQAKAAIDLRL